MNEVIQNLTSDEDLLVPMMVFGAGTIIAVVAIVFSAVKKMVVSSNVEKSRREIAAYIAEGSMTPDDGERLMNAGPRGKRCG